MRRPSCGSCTYWSGEPPLRILPSTDLGKFRQCQFPPLPKPRHLPRFATDGRQCTDYKPKGPDQ